MDRGTVLHRLRQAAEAGVTKLSTCVQVLSDTKFQVAFAVAHFAKPLVDDYMRKVPFIAEHVKNQAENARGRPILAGVQPSQGSLRKAETSAIYEVASVPCPQKQHALLTVAAMLTLRESASGADAALDDGGLGDARDVGLVPRTAFLAGSACEFRPVEIAQQLRSPAGPWPHIGVCLGASGALAE